MYQRTEILVDSHFFCQQPSAQKNEFCIKDFFSKCKQIRSFLRMCLHLLRKSLTEKLNFRVVIFAKTDWNKRPLLFSAKKRSYRLQFSKCWENLHEFFFLLIFWNIYLIEENKGSKSSYILPVQGTRTNRC